MLLHVCRLPANISHFYNQLLLSGFIAIMGGFNLENLGGKYHRNLPKISFAHYLKVWSFCEDKNSFVRHLQQYLQEYKLQHVEHGDKIFRDLCSSLRYCLEYKE